MTKEEALKMLDETPFKTVEKPSKINPNLTCAEGVKMVRNAIVRIDGHILNDIFRKRVLQVTKNQKRPYGFYD